MGAEGCEGGLPLRYTPRGLPLTCSITSSWECSVSKSLTSSWRTWGCRSWWQVQICKQARGSLAEPALCWVSAHHQHRGLRSWSQPPKTCSLPVIVRNICPRAGQLLCHSSSFQGHLTKTKKSTVSANSSLKGKPSFGIEITSFAKSVF